MGGAPGDGRLDLDELGEVIDRAHPLGTGAAVDVLEGPDGTTWRERLEAAGVTPWLRRHRGPLTIAAVVVLGVGGTATIWLRSLPPPVDPEVRATVRDAVPDGSVQFGPEGDVVSATVVVSAATPGDVIVVRGLDGPGIRASTAATGTRAGTDTTAEVTVVTGCDDPRSLEPPQDAYRLDVTRTDASGRATDGELPVPSTISAPLAQFTGGACFQQLLVDGVEATRLVVEPDAERRAVRLDVDLRNSTSTDVAVFGMTSTGETVATSNEPAELSAGATTTVPVTAVVFDCRRPHLDQAAAPVGGQSRTWRQVDGVSLSASPADSISGTGGQIVVAWTPDQQAEIQGELDLMCAGSPDVTATVLDAGPAPADGGLGTWSDVVWLRLHVEVRTTGTRVALSDGTVPAADAGTAGPERLTSASAPVVGGRATLTVDWAAPCTEAANPPTVQLAVAAGGTTYPLRAVLDQQPLARAYATACPQLVADDLQSSGWPPA